MSSEDFRAVPKDARQKAADLCAETILRWILGKLEGEEDCGDGEAHDHSGGQQWC